MINLYGFHGSLYKSYPENPPISSKIIMCQGQDQAKGLCWLVFRWATAKENLNTGGRSDPKSDKIWPESDQTPNPSPTLFRL